MVFYDSPERIIKTLKIISEYRNNPQIAIGRELSKLFEEVLIDNADNIIEHFKDGIKGEIVCMVYADDDNDILPMHQQIKLLKSKGFKDKEISIILSELFNLNKNEVYKTALDITSK